MYGLLPFTNLTAGDATPPDNTRGGTNMAKKQQERKARESATGTTPTPQELGAGTKLAWPRKGQVHRATIIERAGEYLVQVGRQTFKSLSSAAQSISGHAERGGTVWRREGEDRPLLGRPDYRALAGATPGPKPKAAKKGPAKKPASKKGAAKAPAAGKVKTRPAIKCTHKGCGEVFATTAEATAHVAEAH